MCRCPDEDREIIKMETFYKFRDTNFPIIIPDNLYDSMANEIGHNKIAQFLYMQ